jgi:SAM-dependent methyltransferase
MWDIFFEIHSNLPREGPGDFEATRKAYLLMWELPPQPVILDIGCGTGRQTLDLAQISPAQIIAIDNHRPFIDHLNSLIRTARLAQRIQAFNANMFNLPFRADSFDVLWAEGSIYVIGFEKGLQEWRKFLKPGGYLAVTEVCWLKDQIPQELADFWQREYPAIRSVPKNLETIRHCGYKLINDFILPQSAWFKDYYLPMEKRIVELQKKYRTNPEILAFLKTEQQEIELYRRYYDYYGYIFFVMQNPRLPGML